MAGLRLFTSNRLEILADKLGAVLSAPPASPLTPEVIIVQSTGMERWLAMEIARRQGICANIRFPFPKAFVEEALAAVLGPEATAAAFTPEAMTWKLMKLLPSFLDHPGFRLIRRYLKATRPSPPVVPGENNAGRQAEGGEGISVLAGDGLKRYQLAERIAWLFDQYLIFRPDMMVAWEQGRAPKDDEIWQCELWRALTVGAGKSPPAARKEAFIQEINAFRRQINVSCGDWDLPERISLFGIATLPRYYLEVLHALSQLIEVNMFLMNPSREFWGDIRSDREIDRAVAKVREAKGDYGFSGEGLYLERGNRLLASCGTAGREFFALIGEFAGEEGDFFAEPGEDDLLAAVQSDILNLRDRGPEDRKVIASEDLSLQFHSCHSPQREVEALYDNLLSLFEQDGNLLPRDILVMAPDIEIYAPLIKAVFDGPPGLSPADSRPHLPFTIADRGSRAESSVIEGFIRVLAMAGGRFGAGEVLALLEIPEIGAKFGLRPADFELIRRWVAETGIRWGIDGENRRRLGLPGLRGNTWGEGLDRLIMGYAVPGKDLRLVDGILPYDVEGSEAAVLGRFLEYTETLFPAVVSLARSRTMGEWSLFLTELLDGLFASREDGEAGMEQLRSVLLRLQELAEASDFQEVLDISVIKSWLVRSLSEKGFGYGFLAGGITFCSLLPMRSIPCSVICLLGMNGGDYPRRSWTPAFDLMAKRPQPGDRSRRKDDRYLFLEALLSARKRLIISYVGQSSEDNSLFPPSVLVTELLDYLQEGFSLPGGGDIAEHLLTRHRLQAFSPAYFQGKRGLFSYSAENWQAARCLVERKERAPAFVPLISLPSDTWRNVAIADLVIFFADPVRFLFQRRLGAKMETSSDLPEEREPFRLEGLEKYDLTQSMVAQGLAGRDRDGYLEVVRAAGRLPHGAMGVCSYGSLQGEVQGFVEKVRPFLAGQEAVPLTVDLTVAGFRLGGEIPLYGGRIVHFRPATLKIKDHLRLWISHLVLLSMTLGRAASTPAVLLGKGEAWRYTVPPDPQELLAALLARYWEGLTRPLKLFPRSSWEYGKAVFQSGKPWEEGMKAAARTWRGNDFEEGEGADPVYRHCFGDRSPLDEEFQETASQVLGPLFHYREKVKDGEV